MKTATRTTRITTFYREILAVQAGVELEEAIEEAGNIVNAALDTQPQLKRIAGNVSDMTIWRWRRAGLLPEPTSIRGRNYWPVRDIRAALGRLMQVQGGVAA